MERESMEFDVVIVGAGPSGLATACRLGQLAQENEQELMICVVEKGADIGAHILSGAVFEPRALNELFPDWKERGAPLNTEVTGDDILLLKDEDSHTRLPDFTVPKTFHNKGNYIASMGNLCRWMAEQAEQLGVEIFPGFAASEILYNEDGSVAGIQTGDMGVAKDGSEKDGYMPGMELRAKYTLFAEGCRGHLGKELINKFELDKDSTPQHYGLGFKEIWDIPEELHEPGKVVHTAGWPLTDSNASGGGYLYHAEDGQVYLGLIVDLNYANPYLNPFQEFQRFKTHPAIKNVIENGKRVSYGARAITKGGYYSLPKMTFPGGLLVGCNAGTLNFAKIKGNHTAMKSGMVAAECVFEQLKNGKANDDISSFKDAFENSWVFDELYRSRNFGGAVHKLGTMLGGAYNMVDQNWFGGKLPFKFKEWTPDYKATGKAEDFKAIDYPKPDNKLTFDRLSSVFLSNTNHAEDQPCHLKLENADIPLEVNLPKYAEPAQRYCPAGVYEVVEEDGKQVFQINAQNCIHCKTCDIKDPSQNITWVVPEGGGGPTYPNM
ncbi:electron transfer flavoprotein-ubiquinone oxidoreductase [Idiomarina abyssalis]|uniref:Electron transfer flavoprotein-ubiquinone oxidoreductase n=1 Tax=Idiomarina abyssalis TaxID=86102 RepID=A0A8I1KGY7_9GAMM|nr:MULTISPECIES: electron transfer flavoprotein-ubiquinone oxidoreductase [Idiomarina]MAB21001.1 electron transfer flavoprotein-ubiquinone oxidoreductase [Idiomarina sp.]MBH95558.1 electron transfer flavoprotein-ubiquinone oxidoreductase [Idiomarina sp.]MBJ7266550.1 electron transfer flavoprotein-ubiquinone oxidoreductase [Idiomarina abyssalis]MBJ7272904.1 electron transfer flavoprotein-ubiquinone oxidoreductase [Idiomarina abyssalis]MBJ7315437.1 electron transfer flavoprotein-ubiquinone oxido